MIKPYLNVEQRQCIILKTSLGAFLELNIALKKLFREFDKPIKDIIHQLNNIIKNKC